jgi:hypothetical protein
MRFQQSPAAIGQLERPESRAEDPSLISPHSLSQDGPFRAAAKTRGRRGISSPLCTQGQGEQSLVMSRIEINRLLQARFALRPVTHRLMDHAHQVIRWGAWALPLYKLLAKSNRFITAPKIRQL